MSEAACDMGRWCFVRERVGVFRGGAAVLTSVGTPDWRADL